MANRHAQRIGRIAAGQTGQRQQTRHHVLHLRLDRAPGADHRLLDLRGRIFGHAQLGRHQRANRRAARLAQQQGRLGIDVDEHLFDGRAVRLVGAGHFGHTVQNHFQARRQIALAALDGAGGNVAQLRSLLAYDAKAGRAQAGVDAENYH